MRFLKIIVFLLTIGIGVAIILKVFNDNIVFFWGPADIVSRKIIPSTKIVKVGGLVKVGSVDRDKINGMLRFVITDGNNEIQIIYKGILPNLFREGQSTIATGYLRDGYFDAEDLLAKHDENYIPKEVARHLK
jgi:cytochrome c-type biogenesis protein CcmE